MKGTALFLGLLALCAAGAAAEWVKPGFCKERDCPRFVMVEEADGNETRRYDEALWAWIEFKDVKDDPAAAIMEGGAELANYFMGHNKDSKQIVMGTPLAHNITMHEEKSAGGLLASLFDRALGRKKRSYRVDVTLKAYLPYSYQDGQEEPPKPSSKHVHVDKFPAWTAHVRGFESWPTKRNFKKEAKKFVKYLEEDDKDFVNEWAIFSIYNLPTELSHHYNEVLFSAEMGRKGQAGSGEAGASGGVV